MWHWNALRVSLWEDEERQRERDKKEKARKRVREEAKVAPRCRVLYPEAEAEVPKQAFRKLKEDKIVIDVMSSDEEAPVAADGGGKGRAGARQHVAMGVRVDGGAARRAQPARASSGARCMAPRAAAEVVDGRPVRGHDRAGPSMRGAREQPACGRGASPRGRALLPSPPVAGADVVRRREWSRARCGAKPRVWVWWGYFGPYLLVFFR